MSGGFHNRRPAGPVLSPDQGARQGQVVRAAAAALPDMAAVRTFLNSHHARLRGRPLDLAVASDAGLRSVEMELGAGGHPGPHAPLPAAAAAC